MVEIHTIVEKIRGAELSLYNTPCIICNKHTQIYNTYIHEGFH